MPIKFCLSTTVQAIESLRFQVIPHLPIGPDVAPRDFFFFFFIPNLKNIINSKGTKFDSDEKIKADVERWFAAQDEQIYLEGITKLV